MTVSVFVGTSLDGFIGLEAGAVSLEAPWDTPYGDRRGMVKDPCGNTWQIATHKRETNP